MTRKLVSSASPFEREIGFSRAVRVGNVIEVAGTAPIGVSAPGDAYAQAKRIFEIIGQALRDAGGDLRHVTRTRVMVTDMAHWRAAMRAHGEVFGEIRPASTVLQVSSFIDPEWLVEIEATAIVDD